MRHLDTNIVVTWARGRDAQVARRVEELDPKEFAISFIVEAELRVGVLKDPTYAAARRATAFVESARVVQSSTEAILAYAEIRSSLERTGTRISDNDLWVGAVALAENATLVTLNARELSRVLGLKIEDWRL